MLFGREPLMKTNDNDMSLLTRSPGGAIRATCHQRLSADFCVVGGGVAGTCAALAAARSGLRTVLIQDRPVLGGNGSSEVRLWWLGATCHGLTNNRWAREAGIVNEILLDNLYANPEGNPVLVDMILLDKVAAEENITLLLNSACHAVEMAETEPNRITAVEAFCSQNSTRYTVEAPLYCDASGDGIVGFMAGAAFRMGAEAQAEFGEPLAPDQAFGGLLGDSIYFYTKDAGRSVPFVAPKLATKLDPERVRMLKHYRLSQHGCQLWWIETGGRLDTVHQAEAIKWELWQIVYGLWDYIKNSGEYPDSDTMTLEWVGMIPGKRESRRFEGDYMLTQQDVVHAAPHSDTVGFGGWSIDLHPADGVYSQLPSAIQYNMRRLYPIPFRCLYSRNIQNLFLGGRIHSASHVAFGSTRVMSTLGQLGESIGYAAKLATEQQVPVAQVNTQALQQRLVRQGFHLPQTTVADPDDLAASARASASSHLAIDHFEATDRWCELDRAIAQMIPMSPGPLPNVSGRVRAEVPQRLEMTWAVASLPESHTPDVELSRQSMEIPAGESEFSAAFPGTVNKNGYLYFTIASAKGVSIQLSDQRVTGVLALKSFGEQRDGDSHGQYIPAEEAGCEAFSKWYPERRPGGQNMAIRLSRPVAGFAPSEVLNPHTRPVDRPNAWVADIGDPAPWIRLDWDEPQTIEAVRVFLDCDWDHPVETVIKQHCDRVMPALLEAFMLSDGQGTVLAKVSGNRAPYCDLIFDRPHRIRSLKMEVKPFSRDWPAAVFCIRAYSSKRMLIQKAV